MSEEMRLLVALKPSLLWLLLDMSEKTPRNEGDLIMKPFGSTCKASDSEGKCASHSSSSLKKSIRKGKVIKSETIASCALPFTK